MRALSVQLMTGRGISKLSRVTDEAVGNGISVVRNLDQGLPLAEVSTARRHKQLGNALLYQPNGLWIQLRPTFRSGGIYTANSASGMSMRLPAPDRRAWRCACALGRSRSK